jgi:hypothetical protein
LSTALDGGQRALLERCKDALDDWVTTYASEMCDVESVRRSEQRIMDNGGTLAYVAQLVQDIRDALK